MGFFGFLKEALVEETSDQKTKKNLSFFGFLPYFNLGFLQKTKKTKVFFLVFKNLNQKKQKNSRKTQKKHLWTWNQNFSKKFCFFGFLVFSRFRHIVSSCSAAIADQELNRYIYKIVVVGYNLCYLGSTCEKLSKRMERHRADYKIYVDGKKHFTTSYQYQMNMEKRKSELIENYPCLGSEELLKGEGFHIQNAECINFVWQKKLQNTKNITIR